MRGSPDASDPGPEAPQPPSEPPSEPPASPGDDPVKLFDLDFSLGSGTPLPSGLLPPETLERLRSGGQLSKDEVERLLAAAPGGSGMVQRLLGGLVAAGFTEVQEATSAAPLPPVGKAGEAAGHPDAIVIPGSVQKFEWRWDGDKAPVGSGTAPPDAVLEPATYYEALTGRPDPNRGFFITFRRVLDIATWIIALGLPLGLVALGIATGESSETIFFMGFFGLLVGLMIKRSLPKTPFD